MYAIHVAALIGIISIRHVSAHVGHGFTSFSRFQTRQHYANPAQTVSGVNLVQCLELCQRTTACRSVAYCPDTTVCEVNEISPTDISVPSILSSDWTIFYPSEYDVMSGAIATMPTTFCAGDTCYDASRAIDGNTDGDLFQGSCAQSQLSPSTFTIDLQAPVTVHKVVIFFRTDCCFGDFKNIVVRVYDEDGSLGICNGFTGPPSSVSENPITLTCFVPTYGNTIEIVYGNSNPMTICEVAVLTY